MVLAQKRHLLVRSLYGTALHLRLAQKRHLLVCSLYGIPLHLRLVQKCHLPGAHARTCTPMSDVTARSVVQCCMMLRFVVQHVVVQCFVAQHFVMMHFVVQHVVAQHFVMRLSWYAPDQWVCCVNALAVREQMLCTPEFSCQDVCVLLPLILCVLLPLILTAQHGLGAARAGGH